MPEARGIHTEKIRLNLLNCNFINRPHQVIGYRKTVKLE
jgi:hypothetical protein